MYNEQEYFTYTNNQKQKIKEMDFQQPTKATLDGKPLVNQDAQYFIDFSKLNRMEDLIMILACVGFVFSPQHPHFEFLQQFLALDKPVLPGNKPQPQELKMPKLTPVTKKDA
jgi:hypothetical protein